MKREFLQSLDLSDEVINQIMAEHGKAVQATQEKLTAAESQLAEANSTLTNLKKANKDNEELQKEMKSYKDKVAQLEKEAIANARKQSIKDALVNAGATDIDYLAYKLGDLETDADGNLVDLENKIKDLQTNYSDFFKSSEQENNGFKPLGGADLPKGRLSKSNSIESVISDKSINLTEFLKQQAEGE